jgi:dTDP-4-dehydrorhamnose 3,5-epimerase
MKIIETGIPGLVIIEPRVFGDERGYFLESYNTEKYLEVGINCQFVQDNESMSKYGVIRGLHYQLNPYSQSKLVRAIKGKVIDVAIDLRKNSPTFGKSYSIELSEENKLQFFIPKGFAHGFSVISEMAIFSYKCDSLYNPSKERGINPLDPTLNINWKIEKDREIISSKDMATPMFNDAEMDFSYIEV